MASLNILGFRRDSITGALVVQGGTLGVPWRAFGLKGWNIDPSAPTAATAPTAGTGYAMSLDLEAGQVISNLHLDIVTAAAGVAPTAFFMELCSATLVLAATGDVKADGDFAVPNAIATFPLTASFTIPTSGQYFAVLLQVGSWGTTQPTFNRVTGAHGRSDLAVPQSLAQATLGTALAALPAVGQSPGAYSAAASPLRYWVGVS